MTTSQDGTSHHGLLFAAGFALLLVLFAAGVTAAAFRMPAEKTPVTLQSLALAGIAAPTLTRSGDGIRHPGGDAGAHAFHLAATERCIVALGGGVRPRSL